MILFFKEKDISKRQLEHELEKRSLHFKHLESFFLNPKNHDIIFSICGNLLPAHLIIIESISPKFAAKATELKANSGTDPVLIQSLSDLMESDANNENSTECATQKLLVAFKIYLKYFYAGRVAFEEIPDIETAFTIWSLGNKYFEQDVVKQFVEPKIVELFSVDTLNEVFKFINANQIESLKVKLAEFLRKNEQLLNSMDTLPLSCADIGNRVDLLDNFLGMLNLNQSKTIGHIRYYIENCEELGNKTHSGVNVFPNSLLFFRCTVADLKELVQMGFISYEILADELENRLYAKERYCEEKCSNKPPNVNGAVINHHHHTAGAPRRRA